MKSMGLKQNHIFISHLTVLQPVLTAFFTGRKEKCLMSVSEDLLARGETEYISRLKKTIKAS